MTRKIDICLFYDYCELKQSQTFFGGAYSNLTPYRFLSKNIKTF